MRAQTSAIASSGTQSRTAPAPSAASSRLTSPHLDPGGLRPPWRSNRPRGHGRRQPAAWRRSGGRGGHPVPVPASEIPDGCGCDGRGGSVCSVGPRSASSRGRRRSIESGSGHPASSCGASHTRIGPICGPEWRPGWSGPELPSTRCRSTSSPVSRAATASRSWSARTWGWMWPRSGCPECGAAKGRAPALDLLRAPAAPDDAEPAAPPGGQARHGPRTARRSASSGSARAENAASGGSS